MASKSRGQLLSLKCAQCGGDFQRYASNVRHPRPTCSLSCARSLTHNKPQNRGVLDCERCGETFTVIASRLDSPRKARFCSKECKDRTLTGEGHPKWTGGDQRSWAMRAFGRKLVAERGKCELCGSKDGLHAHHIKHRKEHPELAMEPSNILVVCPPCHAKQHPEIAYFLAGGHA